MDLKELQKEHMEWLIHNFPDAKPWEALVGALEELGELAHAHLKGFNNIRGLGDSTDFHTQSLKSDAVGDVVIYLASYCNSNGIDLDESVTKAWLQVSARDWTRNPLDGKV